MVLATYDVYVSTYGMGDRQQCEILDGRLCDRYGDGPSGAYLHGRLSIDIGRYGSPREMCVIGVGGEDFNALICNRGCLDVRVRDLSLEAMKGMHALPAVWHADGKRSDVRIPVDWDRVFLGMEQWTPENAEAYRW